MCGRFSLTNSPQDLEKRFGARFDSSEGWDRHYNAAPGILLPVVLRDESPTHEKHIQLMKWTFVPEWAASAETTTGVINARAEGIAQKPYYKRAYQRRRCLVPANGFFEWKKTGREKHPFRIYSAEDEIISYAGLWEIHADDNGNPVPGFAIITVNACEPLQAIHNRMPAILSREEEETWLNPKAPPADWLEHLSVESDFHAIRFYEVSPVVNSSRNESPDVWQRAGGEGQSPLH